MDRQLSSKYDFNEAKKEYREYCEKNKDRIYIFQQAYWLDAVAGSENWDVLLYKKDVDIMAFFVFCYTKEKKGIRISNPQLTQFTGLHIEYPQGQKVVKKYNFEKEVMNYFIDELEKLDLIEMNLSFSIDINNWQPFYWKGFNQTTYYSFRIENIKNIDRIESEFSAAKKKNIKKALRSNLTIKYDLPAKDFYENHKLTLAKQNQKISYSFELFERIYNAVYNKKNGRVIYAVDKKDNITAALFVVWNPKCAFDLISTIDPDYRNNGSATLLVFEIIKLLSQQVEAFDFEGSMIEGVANSFAQFGAALKPYYRISKVYNKRKLIISKVRNRVKNKGILG